MKVRTILCPKDMRNVSDESSAGSAQALPASIFQRRSWKKYLSQLFLVPYQIRIKSYQKFNFRTTPPNGGICKVGTIFVKPLTSSTEWWVLNLHRSVVHVGTIVFNYHMSFLASFQAKIPELDSVKRGKILRSEYLRKDICE